MTTAMTIDGTDYTEQTIGCYCFELGVSDVDGDGVSDCLDLNGALCVPTDEGDDNYADACLTDDNEITDAIL